MRRRERASISICRMPQLPRRVPLFRLVLHRAAWRRAACGAIVQHIQRRACCAILAVSFSQRMSVAMATGARVLVVDDEPDIRQTIKDILDDEGYVVDVAESAAARAVEVESPSGFDRHQPLRM